MSATVLLREKNYFFEIVESVKHDSSKNCSLTLPALLNNYILKLHIQRKYSREIAIPLPE